MVVQIEGIMELLMYAVAMAIGAIMAVAVPYMLKVYVDDSIKFDKRYFLVMLFAIALAVLFGLPDKVDIINVSILKIAIFAGYGLSSIVKDLVKSIIEKGEAGKPT